MTTGERIRAIRKKKGLSQKDLGEMLGVSGTMVGQYETGQRKPRLDTLQRIAVALNVDWMDLVQDGQQGQVIADHMTELMKNAGPLRKISAEEAYRLGILNLTFNSEEDRIAYFYGLLNTDGKLIASRCFYQYLDKDKVCEVADYVEKLSEIPQYQRTEAPQSPPSSQGGTPPEGSEGTQKPSKDKNEVPQQWD